MCRLAIYYDFSENKTLAVQLEIYDVCSAQKIYNVVSKIKRNWMQERNTIEEVLYLSTQRGYTIFHRNREESNVLSDIVIAHPTSIAMIRTLSYVLIMDTTYKTNKVQHATIRSYRDDSDREELHSGNSFYHLYFTFAMSNGYSSIINEGEPLVILTDRESGLMLNTHRSECVDKLTEMVKDEERQRTVLRANILCRSYGYQRVTVIWISYF
ncbi:hypothetical protein M9H77_25164 [Catharanthus roseus]|uniref:Uncharacterized protein n=1 Tax=Catharanthus roseus TaxID=4058 RepID=A0ACC0AA50_CATRO|nr:hypothetical protein M9H77_25164 [Catharanthus roseus]